MNASAPIGDTPQIMTITDPTRSAPEPEPETSSRPARVRIWRRIGPSDAFAHVCLLLGALWVTAHLWKDVRHRLLASNPGDHTQFEWMLAHAARLFVHPENPFFSREMNLPDGVNLMANTSALGLTIPLAPVTLIWGAPVAFAVMLTLALWLTASAWYHVFSRHLVRSRPAAFVGAVLCGFAPALVAHASGQPNLVAQFAVPFIALTVLRLPGRPVARGILLGLLVVYQVFVNEEVLFFFAMGIGVLVLLYAVLDPRRVRQEWRRFATGLGVAAAVAIPLLAYPLYWQFTGAQGYHGLPFPPSSYTQDVLAYVTYARESIGGRTPVPALGTSPNEDNSSFGWPLLALSLAVTVLFWKRSRLVRAASLTAVVFAALSLGPNLTVGGRKTHYPGPFRLLLHVPLVDLSVPGRFTLVVIPIVGMLLALGVQEAIDATPRMRAAGVRLWTPLWVIVLLGALVPVLPTPVPATGRPPVPAFITSGQWRRYVPAGRTIVPVPLGAWKSPEPLLWQAVARLDFAMPRGYFLGPSGPDNSQAMFGAPPRPTSSKLYAVSVLPGEPVPFVGGDSPLGSVKYTQRPTDVATRVTAADRGQALADLRYWRAAVIVLAPVGNEEQLWRTTSDLVGFRPKFVGGVWLWDVRALVG
jgi:hypothetical protein